MKGGGGLPAAIEDFSSRRVGMKLLALVSLLLGSSAAAWLPHAQVSVAARRGTTRALVRAAAAGNDQLVAQLRAAKPKDIAEILAKNINAIDQRLFLSLADLADATDDDDERDEIARLSSTVASTLETLLSKVRGEVEHPHPYDLLHVVEHTPLSPAGRS